MTGKMKIASVLCLIASLCIFNSCSENFILKGTPSSEVNIQSQKFEPLKTKYGTYLAGRVAHIRQNYDIAADYYMASLDLGLDNQEVLNSTYLLLASEGRMEKAAEYALKAREKGDQSNLILFILMATNMEHKDYQAALDSLSDMEKSPLNNAVLPLFQSWILTGLNNKDESFKKLEVLAKDKTLLPLYHMHKGMIADYFDDQETALTEFDAIIEDESMPLSFRALQVIGNFYLRVGQKDKVIGVIDKYFEKNKQAPMLKALKESFEQENKESTQKIIDTPQKGLAEAVFNIGTLFRGFQNEVAQLFTSLVLYLNPNFEVARISMADLYERAGRYDQAIEEYLSIGDSSPAYFVAQLKAAENYETKKDNEKAYDLLVRMLEKYPNNVQVTFHLGEVSRALKKYDKAVLYYQKTLDALSKADKDRWTVYYALGMSYERQNKWNDAEQAFKKALITSRRHPYVLNYLGYSWIERGMNYNEALYMIFEAHRKDPTDGHIMDSVGWALYKMGKYADAVKVLERASEYLPSNAVVFEHLGDAYWQAGRKNEARYQWQHALKSSEDRDEINESDIMRKIEHGTGHVAPVAYDEQLLAERLKTFDENAQ
ncbi:MAG: tetratricopeptide repeat protein [Alphaproteobacteria bacterium]|nr:tetratricopeptide repeat protein [Alphaproteobacteria bacterium]